MAEHTTIEVAGHELRVSNPGKVFFPEIGVTKLDLVNYYLEVADAALNHLRNRPTVLKRFDRALAAVGERAHLGRLPAGSQPALQRFCHVRC